jgi:hypothetical protein
VEQLQAYLPELRRLYHELGSGSRGES